MTHEVQTVQIMIVLIRQLRDKVLVPFRSLSLHGRKIVVPRLFLCYDLQRKKGNVFLLLPTRNETNKSYYRFS